MRRLLLAALCLLMPGLERPGRAHEPVPPPSREYYGPYRICDENFAFDVAAGEGYVRDGYAHFPHLILFTGGYLTIGGVWTRDSNLLRHAHPGGEIKLQGRRLERLQMNPPGGSAARFAYRFDGVTMESNRFDGSDRDRTILERIAFGDRAREMCASVPVGLRPGPEGEPSDVYLLAPTFYRGPLTLCMAGLAFDLRRGELARLPWSASANHFQVIEGGRRTSVSGLDERVWRRSGEPEAKGPVARDPRFTTEEVHHRPAWGLGGTFGPSRDRVLVALSRRPGKGGPPPQDASPVGFAFDRATSAAERRRFIERLRTRRPGDKCLAGKTP